MGLKDLMDDEGTSASKGRHRRYKDHERQDELEGYVDEFGERFPGGVQVDFIEVSPSMDSNAARTYTKVNGGEKVHYIRIAEFMMGKEDHRIKNIILKAMINLYLNQNGHEDVTVNSDVFNWLCGALGCIPNKISFRDDVWLDVMEPLIDEEFRGYEFPDEPPEGA